MYINYFGEPLSSYIVIPCKCVVLNASYIAPLWVLDKGSRQWAILFNAVEMLLKIIVSYTMYDCIALYKYIFSQLAQLKQ